MPPCLGVWAQTWSQGGWQLVEFGGRSAAPRQFLRLHILLWRHCACQPSNMLSGQWPILCVPLARPWHLVIQSNKDLGVAIEECVGACRLPVVPGHFK